MTKLKNPRPTRDRINEVREQLVARFPKCFMPRGHDKLPLKVGIRRDLHNAISVHDIPPVWVTAALSDYASGPKYLMRIVEGAERIDLNGDPAGVVTRKQAEHAINRLNAPRLYRWRAWLAQNKPVILTKLRPLDYAELPPHKQMEVDKRLGILDLNTSTP
jgi:sRNA-binding protein